MSNRWSIGSSRRLKMRPRLTSLCQLGASCRAESTRPLRRGFGSFWSSSSPVTPSSARSLRAESSSRRCRKARLCSRTSSSSSCSRRSSPTSRLRPNLRCSGCTASRQATGFTAPGRGATLCLSGCCSSRSFRCRGWSSRPRRCPSKTRCVLARFSRCPPPRVPSPCCSVRATMIRTSTGLSTPSTPQELRRARPRLIPAPRPRPSG